MLLTRSIRSAYSVPSASQTAVALVLLVTTITAAPAVSTTSGVGAQCSSNHGPPGFVPIIYLFPLDVVSESGATISTNFTGLTYSLGGGDLAAVGSDRLTNHLTSVPDGKGNTMFGIVGDSNWPIPAGGAVGPWTMCNNDRLAFEGNDGFAWCTSDGKGKLYANDAVASSTPGLGSQHCQAVHLVPRFGPDDPAAGGANTGSANAGDANAGGANTSVTVETNASPMTGHVSRPGMMMKRSDYNYTDGQCDTNRSLRQLVVEYKDSSNQSESVKKPFYGEVKFSMFSNALWAVRPQDHKDEGAECLSIGGPGGKIQPQPCTATGGVYDGSWCITKADQSILYQGNGKFIWCSNPKLAWKGKLYLPGAIGALYPDDGEQCFDASFLVGETLSY